MSKMSLLSWKWQFCPCFFVFLENSTRMLQMTVLSSKCYSCPQTAYLKKLLGGEYSNQKRQTPADYGLRTLNSFAWMVGTIHKEKRWLINTPANITFLVRGRWFLWKTVPAEWGWQSLMLLARVIKKPILPDLIFCILRNLYFVANTYSSLPDDKCFVRVFLVINIWCN